MRTVLDLRAGVATDVGRVRHHNEDAAVARGSVFVVADGMGGHAAGEVASEIAARTVGGLDGVERLRMRDIVAGVQEANEAILRSATDDPRRAGMGTTLTGLAVVEVSGSDHWAVFNMGDSRVYRLSGDGELELVTVDHSEVQELVDAGWITEDEAWSHPSRNVVTRSLGRDPMAELDTWVFPQHPGERFLLCSDGLTNEVASEDLRRVLVEYPDAQAAADALVDLACERGGHDNVTVIVVSAGDAAGTSDVDEDTSPRGPVRTGGW
ncbi:MAG: protein phosphatase 2C domain-containing protein [Lapillicoccus sp.]